MSWTKRLICLIIAQYDVQSKHPFLGKNPISGLFLARMGGCFLVFDHLRCDGNRWALVCPSAIHAFRKPDTACIGQCRIGSSLPEVAAAHLATFAG